MTDEESADYVVAASDAFLDFGAIQVPMLEGLDIALHLEHDTQRGVGLGLTYGSSMADVQVFARAKDEHMWPSTRDELIAALAQQQVSSEIVIGTFGSEVRCTLPTIDFDGNNIIAPARFVGVDGDRWFMRIAISGAAAVDRIEVDKIDQLIGKLIVTRGDAAMSPGEALTLTIPA